MGGAQAVNYLVALLRVKIVAVLLGPSGVGLVSLYSSAMTLVGSLTGFGIGSSGVRAVADAYGRDDSIAAARMVQVLRRACWVTGFLGWAVSVALAVPISRWMTGSTAHAWAVAVLGSTLLVGAITGGQMALLQGLRRIGDIARANVAAAVLNTLVAIALYGWLGERGIVPVLIVSALGSLVLSHWFASRIQIEHVDLSWRETLAGAAPLIGLGVAFMWSGLLTAGLDMFTRTLISRQLGVDAAGIYQAAWALSGMFAAFILQAMGADFYPRLTMVIEDHATAVRTVNEQTEIGILLAAPGLLGTLAFAPWVVFLLYSSAFSAASEVLPWMILGIFGRVLSWPMGYILLAMGASRRYMATETVFLALQGLLMWLLIPRFGVMGAAYGFALTYLVYTLAIRVVSRHLIGFRWAADVLRLMVISAGLVLFGFASNVLLSEPWRTLLGSLVCGVGCLVSLRGLTKRLGPEHRMTRWAARVPGSRWVMGT